MNNKWQEIENRIQLSKENIAENNVTEAAANAKKAVELWKQEALNAQYLNKTQEERVTKLVSEIALLQKEGAVQNSIVDVNYNTAYRDWETNRTNSQTPSRNTGRHPRRRGLLS